MRLVSIAEVASTAELQMDSIEAHDRFDGCAEFEMDRHAAVTRYRHDEEKWWCDGGVFPLSAFRGDYGLTIRSGNTQHKQTDVSHNHHR